VKPVKEIITSLRHPIFVVFAAASILYGLAAKADTPWQQGKASGIADAGGGKLEGTWNVTVNICNNGPTVTRLNTFMFGGTMQEFAAFVSPLVPVRRGPGQGVWEHLNDEHYSYIVKFFVFNADSTLTGWRIETRDVIVDVSGGNYTATGTSQLYDTNGNPVGPPLCATETATRFEVPAR
jgi:hypothetical protein